MLDVRQSKWLSAPMEPLSRDKNSANLFCFATDGRHFSSHQDSFIDIFIALLAWQFVI